MLVEMFNSACESCGVLEPELIGISKDYDSKIRTRRINAEDNSALTKTWGIKEFPTLLFFVKGNLAWRHAGLVRMDQLTRMIEETEGFMAH